EEKLTNFLKSENIVELGAQSNALIASVSSFDVQHNMAVIEMQTSSKAVNDIKNELNKYDPQSSAYIESKATDPYVFQLQQEIAKLEIQRDMAKTGNEEVVKGTKSLKDINSKIESLKKTLEDKIDILKKGAESNT